MEKNKLKILLIEDDLLSRLSLKSRLEGVAQVTEAPTMAEALELIAEFSFDLAFVDLDLETPLAGLTILKALKEKSIHSIVLSGREDDRIIEEAYSLGCNDYLSKPFTKSSIDSVLKKYDHSKINLLQKLKDILMTEDPEIINELKTIESAIFGEHPILITGETGTGKTFLAKYIHELIGTNKPFVHLNCAEISESLIESELFGHEKGSFTGAVKSKKGLLEMANGGVLFLDEIGTLPLLLQKKLLKAIEEKTFYPVGSEKCLSSSFRLISATCEDLREKVNKGDFREDFLFRLEGFNVYLKSLKERKQDINGLLNYFLKQNKRRIVLSADARSELLNYSWPGNIRELQKIVEVLRANEKGIIERRDVVGLLQKPQGQNQPKFNLDEVKGMGLPFYLEKLEAQIVSQVLEANNDKVRKTLSDLKLSNNAFYRIMTNLKSEGALHAKSK